MRPRGGMVDRAVLKTAAERREGSNPSVDTLDSERLGQHSPQAFVERLGYRCV